VEAATHKTREEIQLMLARRFPRPDLPERLEPAPAPVVAQPAIELTPAQVVPPAPPSRMMPLSPERFGLQCTLDRETHDLLREAKELMSHQNPSGEIRAVLNRALRLLVEDLRRQKFAATSRPGRPRPGTNPRHIPADVKRVVWARDGGQCAFVSDSGKRCPSRELIEFDHQDLVACGGQATVDKVRLLCSAHNQHMAERALGTAFMNGKRAEAKARAAARRRARAGEESGEDSAPRAPQAAERAEVAFRRARISFTSAAMS
jgi:5-methylcytosine-specific restriction endonuclease McrA